MKLRLRGRQLGVRVTPLRDGRRGKSRYYGPLSGTLTLAAGADARLRAGRKLLRPLRRADERPPRTSVRVRRRGRDAVLRFRGSGVVATYVKVGRRAVQIVRPGRALRVRRGDLKRVRFQSVDVFGNDERPRRL